MKSKSTFIVTLFVFGFLLLAMPDKSFSQELGCCFDPGTNSCGGCGEFPCAISLENCQNNFPNFLFSEDTYCFEGGCSSEVSAGCCVISRGDCKEVASLNTCELGEGGEAYFVGAGCDQVSDCRPPGAGDSPAQVPTLSEWGLIAMAGVLGLVGFMVVRRRKTAA